MLSVRHAPSSGHESFARQLQVLVSLSPPLACFLGRRIAVQPYKTISHAVITDRYHPIVYSTMNSGTALVMDWRKLEASATRETHRYNPIEMLFKWYMRGRLLPREVAPPLPPPPLATLSFYHYAGVVSKMEILGREEQLGSISGTRVTGAASRWSRHCTKGYMPELWKNFLTRVQWK